MTLAISPAPVTPKYGEENKNVIGIIQIIFRYFFTSEISSWKL
jgi:hypothetical protein